VVLLAVGAVGCSGSTSAPASSPATVPRTPLGTQIQFALDLIDGNVTPASYLVHFAPSFLAAVTTSQIGTAVDQTKTSAPWSLNRYISGPSPTDAQLRLIGHLGAVATMTIQIDSGSGLITELLIQPAGAGGSPSSSPALAAKSTAVATELTTGQFSAVRTEFNQTMTAELSEQQLSSSWSQVAGPLGTFVSLAAPISKSLAGYATYFVPVTLSKGSLEVQVSFDTNGQIAGLYLRPAGYDAQF